MLPPPLAHHSWIPAPAGIPAGPCFRSPTPVSSRHRVGVLSHLCHIMTYVRTHLLLIPAREHTLVPRMSSWVAATTRLSWSPPLSPFHLPQHPACSWLLLKPATTLLPQGLCTGSSPSLGCSFLSFFKGCCLLSITDWHLLRARDSLVAQTVKRLSVMWETQVQSLGQEGPLEKEMATHSSTLA